MPDHTAGAKRIRTVRVRGGHTKWRALRLDHGNFSWGSEAISRRTRVLDVVYNASNNELVRTKTLVKNSIVQIDATPYRQWYQQHYGVQLGKATEDAVKVRTFMTLHDSTFTNTNVGQVNFELVLMCVLFGS